ncbi:hypothetical protein OHA09_20300 [Streptomyces longwoodensis]|uniref:hypothetical protein n=1 Tax=Streptomyces longwoodensis TaxID=68231 RepID=UPI0022575B58|nr:hypothetical protein [Streptomyces longwoodensis]MCX4994393.1 hypothetical protein [Streptomyces longwoodensis]WUC59262.1 hypothetical protein OHA09_20300 [Streptomyces longwoodensis]
MALPPPPSTAPGPDVALRARAARRAMAYVHRVVGPAGVPSAEMSLCPGFGQSFDGARARGRLREVLGVDPGFDLDGEGFSAMVALALLAPGGDPELVRRLARQVETCRWRHRYRFLPGPGGLPADTDSTALTLGALYEAGLLPAAGLRAGARELLRSAAPATGVPRRPAADRDAGAVRPGVFMVYWEDGEEPGTLPRGRKQDPVACANALYTVLLADLPGCDGVRGVADATVGFLAEHLTSGRFLRGTRYYPSPDAFLHAVSRLCARFPDTAGPLTAPARRALERTGTGASAVTGSVLEIALRVLAADRLGVTAGQDERRARLARMQRPDGSWPAAASYRMGRFPLFFGSSFLTTVFALSALRPARPAPTVPPPRTGE